MVGMVRNSYNTESYEFRTTNGGQVVSASDSSGKLRLVRTGSTLLGYYWNGTQFVLLGGSSTTTNDTRFALDFSGVPTSPANVKISFANFKVNSATVTMCQ